MSEPDKDYLDAVRRRQNAFESLAGQHRIAEEHQRQIAEEMQRVLDNERAGVKRSVSDLPENERDRIKKAAQENLLKSDRQHMKRLLQGRAL